MICCLLSEFHLDFTPECLSIVGDILFLLECIVNE